VPGDAERLQDVARIGAEVDHITLRHGRLAVEADAELLAHDARTTVAAGKIVAAHGLGRA
jgi:hypothetical protein